MLIEILMFALVFGALAPVVKKKNRSKWLPLLGPALWWAGKYVAAFIAGIICAITQPDPDSTEIILYGATWIGGIAGAFIAFGFVKILPTKNLVCPKCGHNFVNNSEWGVTCDGCGTKLRVSNDQVTIIETA